MLLLLLYPIYAAFLVALWLLGVPPVPLAVAAWLAPLSAVITIAVLTYRHRGDI